MSLSAAELVTAATCYALSYRQTHDAPRRDRGRASAHPCHWCGRRAAEWMCLCADSSVIEGTNATGKPVRYSPVLSEYVPACRSCHRRMDAARSRDARASAHLAVAALPARREARIVAASVPEPVALFPVGWEGESG